MPKASKVFVFSGKFSSIEEACLYSEPQWEAEPEENVSDEVYAAWEDRNPTHRLEQNIDNYLDNDFIETIEDINELSRHQYLSGFLKNKDDINTIKASELSGANIFVLVFQEAFGGFDLKTTPISTPELTYCGEYLVIF